MRPERLTDGGQLAFVNFPTRFAAQTLAGEASARTIGQAVESVIYLPLTGRGVTKLLDAPSNEAWIDPWIDHIRRLGVRTRLGYRLTALTLGGGKIARATVRGPRGRTLPVDWARKLWTPAIRAADPQLTRSLDIDDGWMVGIQLYLRRPTPITAGALACLDSPWAIQGISQAQFWKGRDFAADYGDGTVRDKLSAIICDWDTPGILYGKPARDCTRAEIGADTWAQVRAHFAYRGAPALPDDLLASSFLDPGIRWKGDVITGNDDPLPRCNPGTWYDRPDVASAIPNLLLAGDYVKVDFDITSMEGANEAARRAVGALRDREGSHPTPVRVFDRVMPGEWAALRAIDDKRYAQGRANLFDGALGVEEIRAIIRRG